MKPSPQRLAAIASTLFLMTLASCNPDDSHSAMLKNEIKSLEDKHNQTQGELLRLKAQMTSLTKEKELLKEQKVKLEADLEAAGKALENLDKEFSSYRSQYKLSILERAPGMSLGNFVAEGKTYINVKVREVTDEVIAFMHESGTDKVRWESLPQNLQDLFGYEKPGTSRYVSYVPVSKTTQRDIGSERAQYEEKTSELRKQIAAMKSEMQGLRKNMTETGRATGDAKNQKMDTLDLERAKNAISARNIKLESEIQILENQLRLLQREAPKVLR
jgi:chromosome segregation ATPase